MTIPVDVLIIEDRENDAMLMLRELRRAGYAPNHERVETLSELRRALNSQPWHLVLADYSLPHLSCLDALAMVREWAADVPFIVVSGAIGEETAVATVKAGADDYVLKDNLSRLGPSVKRELRDAETRRARRDAEQELRLQEALFRSLIENIADVIVVLDDRGVVHYQSPSVERVLGYKASEAIGMRTVDCLHPEERDLGRDMLFSRIRRQRQVPHFECRVRHKDGSWRSLEGTITNLLDDPAAHGIVCNFRDATERKNLEQQLVRTQRMEAIGNLAGGIAHDLNNLLTPVLVATDLLTGELSDEDRESLLATLKSGANRAVDVVNQLLSLARGFRAGQGNCDVADVVRDTERLLYYGFPHSIRVRATVADSLHRVSIGATQLGQVLMNLCINARDAMPDGGRLTIAAENLTVEEEVPSEFPEVAPGEYVQLSVTDTGTGISEEIQQRMFDPFFTTKEPGRGTGLGLWIVLRIMDDYGGGLAFDSGPSGTRFSLCLPAAKSPTEAPHPLPKYKISIPGKVLIADGEAALRQIIKETLDAYGCQTLTAADGAEALAVHRKNSRKIGLVIVDTHLPVMDGPAVAAAIRELDPHVPIILQHRTSTDRSELRELTETVTAFLEKPYTTGELLSSVREAAQAAEESTPRSNESR